MFEFAITTRAKNVVKPPFSIAGHIFDRLVCALLTFVPVKICKILYRHSITTRDTKKRFENVMPFFVTCGY